nr:HAD-IIIA family hydrolase [Marinicella sp. W31]MDC2875475.1 HAD-IIIA family hydrolase [Marinicella sp. W31]
MGVEQAVLLVGGQGTRLRSMGFDCPKPMVEIGGRPFLEHVIRHISRYGIRRIVLVAGYKGDMVVDRYHGKSLYDVELTVVVEPRPLGTAGALVFAVEYLDEFFVMSNGDSLFDADLSTLLGQELKPGSNGRLLLSEVEDASRYGAVHVDQDGLVQAFMEKQPDSGRQMVNSGVCLLRREAILASNLTFPASIEADVFPSWVASGNLEACAGEGYFIDIGLPESYGQASAELVDAISRPAAFLDRDGVINVDNGYTHAVEDLVFTPTAIDGIRALNRSGYYVIVVSNQAGVARGYYDESAVRRFHAAMNAELIRHAAHIDAFYFCPYHPDAAIERYKADHSHRKPNPGMIEDAFNDWPITRAGSFLIGDKASDIEAAQNAGIPGTLVEANWCDLAAVVRSATTGK